jgi:hypothetical protein
MILTDVKSLCIFPKSPHDEAMVIKNRSGCKVLSDIAVSGFGRRE